LSLIERYLLRQFLQAFAAAATVLLLVTLGGLFADLVTEIARGKVPAVLLLSQLGLRSVRFLTLVLPLALLIGLLLSIGRLYRDSEMAVLAAIGLGPQDLWRPVALLTVPVAIAVAMASLWLAPLANAVGEAMIEQANRSLLVAGLESGRFMEVGGRGSVLYVGDLSTDGREIGRLFLQSEREGRLDVVTARIGHLRVDNDRERILVLGDGFRVEGVPGQRDFRLLSFARNELRLPDLEPRNEAAVQQVRSSAELWRDGGAAAAGEWHWRWSMPLLTLALGLLALPLARSEPRQPRYGPMLLALGLYVLAMCLLILGSRWLGDGRIPAWLGLWWLHLPLFAIASWLFVRDGHLPARRKGSA
jgi:lipopolysaccharide export system permease protein